MLCGGRCCVVVGEVSHLEWVFSTMVGCIQDLVVERGSSFSVVTGPRSCDRPSLRPNIPRACH